MTSRDTLHTSTTVCPAVMVEGPLMVTVGGGAVRGGRGGGERYYAISTNHLLHQREEEAVLVRQ